VRRTLQHVGFVHAQARQRGEASHDYAGAVALLEEVPEHLRDGALYTKLRRCRDRVAELDSRIRVAVEAMRFADVRAYAEELLRLMPERDDLRRLLEALPADVRLPRRFRNCVGMKLVLIRAGTFLMGSPRSEPQRHGNEGLAREVTVERPFYLGVYPVTQRQYEKVMGRNPSWFCKANRGGSQHPVEQVTWHEAVEFCQRLSEHPDELSAHRVYRLPSEAEWEYACRAGTTTPFSWGASASSTSANFNGHFPYGNGARGPYRRRTTSVGHYEPNSWGLFDLHGNVWEWCSDRYLDGDPVVEEKGRDRVVRGGSWFNEGGLCRSACRLRRSARDGDFNVGFRVTATVSAAPG
jgi:formylglycine-generating enzyme required for sulfatase activity